MFHLGPEACTLQGPYNVLALFAGGRPGLDGDDITDEIGGGGGHRLTDSGAEDGIRHNEAVAEGFVGRAVLVENRHPFLAGQDGGAGGIVGVADMDGVSSGDIPIGIIGLVPALDFFEGQEQGEIPAIDVFGVLRFHGVPFHGVPFHVYAFGVTPSSFRTLLASSHILL